MKYDGHRGEGTESSGSSRAALNPYFIEDIGLTARELRSARRNRGRDCHAPIAR